MKPLCIYHSPCADGFSAAWAVWKFFGDGKVDFHPGVYGEAPPDVTDRHVIMVDFSYKKAVLDEMAEKAASILIIDHHKSAEAELKHLHQVPQSWDDHAADLDVSAWFDMHHSGAVLAWLYFHPGKLIPRFLLHVEDRDLWRFNLEGTRELSSAVFSRPYSLDVWENLVSACEDSYLRGKLMDEGAAINRKHDKDIMELVPAIKRTMWIGGYKVPVANLPYTMASDAGNMMSVGQPFAATYYDGRALRHFSLRSKDGGIDVSEVARKYGGGGHEHAAGFTVELGWEGDLDWGTGEVP